MSIERELRANWDSTYYPEPEPDIQLAAGPSDTVSDAGAAFGIYPGMGKRTQKSDIGEKMILGAPDFAAGAARGAVSAGLGLGGDIQKLGRFIGALASDNEGGTFADKLGRAAATMEDKTFLPSTEDVSKHGYTIPGTSITIPPMAPAVPAGTSAFGLTPEERQKSAEAGQFTGELVGDPFMLVKGASLAGKGIAKGAEYLGPKAAEMAQQGIEKAMAPMMPRIVEKGPSIDDAATVYELTRGERSAVTNAAGRKPAMRQEATQIIQDTHLNYPEQEGWAPIEIKGFNPKKLAKGELEPEAQKIPYNFHLPPEGVPEDAWRSTLAARISEEVTAVVDRAKAGDQAAIDIIKQASWYRSMRDRLRAEFGGIGDVFADVLGTTSAQTSVEQNFANATEILRRFSRGEYDAEIRAYENRVKSGEPVDAKTLTAMHKAGEFPLITKAGGELFNTNSPASMGALLDMFRAVKAGDSPKTPNFTGNLIGLTNEATIDVWAARMLRRVADLPRIPPIAEKGVAGKHLVGSTLYEPKVGSEFGFGQDVFREAAQEINASNIVKQYDPTIGDLGPDDLQAVAWFIEKENWTKNGWTSKAGEGGSLDYEMSLAGAADSEAVRGLRREINQGFKMPGRRKTETDEQYADRVATAKSAFDAERTTKQQTLEGMKADVDRYTLGVSGERPNKPMSNYAQAELAAEFDDVVRNDPSVVGYNLANTYGSFMAQTERALNAEFVAKQNFNPAPLERRLVEQGKHYDQDAVFISKVLRDSSSPNARPGVEIYFKQKITPQQMEQVTAKLREYGVDGFTYVTDMRFGDKVNVQAGAGGADTAGLNGIRFQYIPEFDDGYNAANRAAIMKQKEDLFDDIVEDIMKEGNVSDARVMHYDTKVFFRSDYDKYLARTSGQADRAQGGVQPSGANAPQPDSGAGVGQDFSRSVSDRLRKEAKTRKSKAAVSGGASSGSAE